jgi:hypothetical protein
MADNMEIVRVLSDLTSADQQTRSSAEAALSSADQSTLAVILAQTAAAEFTTVPSTHIRTLAALLLRQVFAADSSSNNSVSSAARAACQRSFTAALSAPEIANYNTDLTAMRDGLAAALVEVLATPFSLSAMLKSGSAITNHSACSLISASLDRAVRSCDRIAIKSVVDVLLPHATHMLSQVFGDTTHIPLASLSPEMLPLATSVLAITSRLLQANARDVSRNAGVLEYDDSDVNDDLTSTSRQHAMTTCVRILTGILGDNALSLSWAPKTDPRMGNILKLLQWSALLAALSLTNSTVPNGDGGGVQIISSSLLWPMLDSLIQAFEIRTPFDDSNLCDSMGDHVSISTTIAMATRLLAAVVLKEAAAMDDDQFNRPFGAAAAGDSISKAEQYLSRVVAVGCLPMHILDPSMDSASSFDANEFLMQEEDELAGETSPRAASLELLLALVETVEPDSQPTERVLLDALRRHVTTKLESDAHINRQLESALFLAGSAALRVGVQVLGGDDQYESGKAMQVVRSAAVQAMASPFALVQARGLWCLGLIAAELHQPEHVLNAVEVVARALTFSAVDHKQQQQEQPRVLVRSALAGESLGRLALALSDLDDNGEGGRALSDSKAVTDVLAPGVIAIVDIAQLLGDDLVYLVFEPLHAILQACPAVASRVQGRVATLIVSQWARSFSEPQARDGLTDVIHSLSAGVGTDGQVGWVPIVMAAIERALLDGNDAAWALYRVTLAARVGTIPVQEVSQVLPLCLHMIVNDGKTVVCDVSTGLMQCDVSVLECTAALARACGFGGGASACLSITCGSPPTSLSERMARVAEYLLGLATKTAEHASGSELLALCVAATDLCVVFVVDGGCTDVCTLAQVVLRAVQALVGRRDADGAFDVCLALCALLLLQSLQQQHSRGQVPRWFAGDIASLDRVTGAWVSRANEVSHLSLRSLVLKSMLTVNLCEEVLSWRTPEATLSILSKLCGMLADIHKQIDKKDSQGANNREEEAESMMFLSDMLRDEDGGDGDEDTERPDMERDRVGSLGDQAALLNGLVARSVGMATEVLGKGAVENALMTQGELTKQFVASDAVLQ